jgi:hypothetical protein
VQHIRRDWLKLHTCKCNFVARAASRSCRAICAHFEGRGAQVREYYHCLKSLAHRQQNFCTFPVIRYSRYQLYTSAGIQRSKHTHIHSRIKYITPAVALVQVLPKSGAGLANSRSISVESLVDNSQDNLKDTNNSQFSNSCRGLRQ